MTERISHVAKNRLLQKKSTHILEGTLYALSFDECQPLIPWVFNKILFLLDLCIWIIYYSPRKYLPYASAALIAAHTVSGVTSNGIL